MRFLKEFCDRGGLGSGVRALGAGGIEARTSHGQVGNVFVI